MDGQCGKDFGADLMLTLATRWHHPKIPKLRLQLNQSTEFHKFFSVGLPHMGSGYIIRFSGFDAWFGHQGAKCQNTKGAFLSLLLVRFEQNF